MYLIYNNQTYPDIRVLSTSTSARFVGESLTGLTELTGPVTVYADNGFEMRSFGYILQRGGIRRRVGSGGINGRL